jgi:hypothetical protein
VFPNFISAHSIGAVSLCALMACLTKLASLWMDWVADPLRAELQNPGRGSADDFYY